MTFSTSLQSLNGTHVPSGTGHTQCAVDWARDRVFIGSGTYIARVGLITGLEETYATTASFGSGDFPPIGLDVGGSIYMDHGGLVAGGIRKIDPDTLTETATDDYPAPYFGGGGMANVSASGGQYVIDVGIGGGFFDADSHAIISRGASYITDTAFVSGTIAYPCKGKAGTNKGFYIESPRITSDPQVLTLRSVTCGTITSFSTIGTIDPTDVDAAWTQIYADGICVDETDGHLLACVHGQSGASQLNYLIKINSTNATIEWTATLPNNSSNTGVGTQFNQSRIRNQRMAIITASHFGTPPVTITIIDTSDGSEITTYTTGLAGLICYGYQCYDDTKGCIVGIFGFSNTTGSPTRLNATPTSYIGWFALDVDEAMEPAEPIPVPGADTVSPYVPPTYETTVRQLHLFPRPPFKEYQCGADGVSVFPVPFRVIEQSDLRVEVDGEELDQADFTYTGRTSQMAGHETGYVTLDTAATNCIVRIWGDRAPARTTDLDDGELDKVTANTELETLWVIDRCQHLLQTRDTTNPLTGAQTLPAAVAGLHYWFQGDCTATRAGSDAIYDGATSGTVLTGFGEDSLAELVCVKTGLWFVRTKSGSWSVA